MVRRGPEKSRSIRALILPTAPGAEIFKSGLAKLGWFNALVAIMRKRSAPRSAIANFFQMPRLSTTRPGPKITERAELPKRPLGGTTKADASNQRTMERSLSGRLPSRMRSGLPNVEIVLKEAVQEPEPQVWRVAMQQRHAIHRLCAIGVGHGLHEPHSRHRKVI